MTDTLKPVAYPRLEQAAGIPRWVSERGGDVRVWDRREGRLVLGPSHRFAQPTDLQVENGIVRFWCGPVGLPPFVNVRVFRADEWYEAGVASFEANTVGVLDSVRLVRVTPDVVTVALHSTEGGDVFLSLHRGERMLRVQHGDPARGISAGRYVRWRGLPPSVLLHPDVAVAAATFGDGLSAGYVKLAWPRQVTPDGWAVTVRWLPENAQDAQPDSGLWSATDPAGEHVVQVEWVAAEGRIRFTCGATELLSPALTFAADTDIFVRASYGPAGMGLTVRVAGSAPSHTSGAAAQAAVEFVHLYVGLVSDGTAWGDGSWGDGVWGGGVLAFGVLDNLMLFDGAVTETEATALAAATVPLGDLPAPEARLVLYLPFDARPIPLASEYSNGDRYEATVLGGSTPSPDAQGLTKALAVLDGTTVALDDLALGRHGVSWDAGILLYISGVAHDDLGAHHSQFAAASQQQLRVG